MSNNKQTAVDWLSGIDKRTHITIEEWQQAKEMEKEQKYKFADEYCEAVMSGCNLRPEQYDNETYGGNK
jgi:hypothetical protein